MRQKKIISAFLAAIFFALQAGAVTAAAQEPQENVSVTPEESPDIRQEQRQAYYDTAPDSNSLTGWPQGPNVYAASAVVMDMDSGAILYNKKMNDRHYPASITKLLTALVALENSDLSDKVTFSQQSIDILSYGDAHIGMKPGEEISMNDALYAVLLASANEVAYAVAENTGNKLGGGYDTFIQMMNKRAQELGCTGSNWVNPHGLHDAQHYTTAHDMALIASAVYQFDDFRKVTQTLDYTIGSTNLTEEGRVFQQNHKMLWPGNLYYYEYCTGGKTGYTDQSGTTLVTMADNGGMRLAAVVLQDYGGDAYDDTRAMFDYAFQNFTKVLLAQAGISEDIESFADPDAYVVLPQGVDVSQLECRLQIVNSASRTGTADYYYQGQNVGHADVILTRSYLGISDEKAGSQADGDMLASSENKNIKKGHFSWIGLALAVAAGIFVLRAALQFYIRYKRAVSRQKQRDRDRAIKKRQKDREMNQ